MSTVRTVFLLTLLTLLLVWVGSAVGGRTGMIVALVIGLVLNFVNFWFSSRIILAAYGAHILEEGQHPWLHQEVRDLADRAGLPMPKVAIVERDAPNAFATGRNPANAVVAVTTGLLRVCDRRQVRAILGHELGHVKNRDMLTMTLVAGAVSAIGFLAMMARFTGGRDDRGGGLLVAIFAPIMAMLIQMGISRSREYGADDSGSEISRDPGGLADALETLHREIPRRQPITTSGATAHMMIANPFFGMNLGELFSTHPSPEKRIQRLRVLARGG